MKRLIKKSIMNIEMFKGSLNQLSNEGRNILKLIEDYKFKLDQTCRLTANDQQLTQKLQQKRKQLDVASGQIYSIVFDIDNIDITQAYEQQQINTNPNMPIKNDNNVQQPSRPKINPNMTNNQTSENTNEQQDSIPVGNGGTIPSNSTNSKEEESETENEEISETENTEEPNDEENNDNGNEE